MGNISPEMKNRLAQAQAIRNLGIGSNVSAKQFNAETQKISQTIGNTIPVSPAEPLKTNKTATGMHKKKEDRIFSKVNVDEVQPKEEKVFQESERERTKREYDDYVASDAHKKKLDELYKKEQQELFKRNLANSLAGRPFEMLKPPDDPEEIRLRAARDQAEAEYNASEDQKVIAQDLEAITGLSAEERRQLEAYVVGRDMDYYDSMNMAQNGFQMGRAQQKAAGLIDKYGQERVDQMANTLSRQNNAQLTQQITEMGQKHGEESPFLGSLGSVAANTVGSIMGTMDYMKELGRNDRRFKTLDPNAMGNIGNVYAGAVRGQVQQNLEESGGLLLAGFENAQQYATTGIVDESFLNRIEEADNDNKAAQTAGNALSIAYQGVMSAADSVARGFLGGGAALAATGSFSQTMAEASQQGASPAQAALLATTTAGIEALTEKIPLDNLIKTAKGTNLSSVLWNALKQAGIEATTEEISLIGTVLAEAAILQEKSSYQMKLTGLLLNGVPSDEARRQVGMDIVNEAVNTLLVSMVSGGVSSLGGSYADERGMFAQQQEQSNPVLNQPSNAQRMEAKTAQVSQNTLKDIADKINKSQMPATNQQARDVLNDPALLTELQEKTGLQLSGKTNAERRKEVKKALNEFAKQDFWVGVGQRMANASRGKGLVLNDQKTAAQDARLETSGQAQPVQKSDGELVQEIVANRVQEVQQQKQAAQEPQPVMDRQSNGERANVKDLNDTFDSSGTVGSAKSRFRHEVRESGVYGNTFKNANSENIRRIGEDVQRDNPGIGQYDLITEQETLNEARLRTGTAQDRYTEHRYLMKKDGWSGADNDVAMRLLEEYRKEGKGDRFRELAAKQRSIATQSGQLSQSFAKYSRADATVAVKDAVEVLEEMSMGDIPGKFWKKVDKTRAAMVGDSDDYTETSASRMTATEQRNTISAKRKMDRAAFDSWKTDITNSMLEIANDIEAVPEGDADSMREIVRQLARLRRTTAWFGTQDRLTMNADRILGKLDFETAKTVAKAQLAMIPDDYRKRSAGEIAKTARIHNMLSALTTVNRNTVGNVAIGAMDAVSDSIPARAMDFALSKFTGIRTVGNDLKYAKTYFNAARDAADMASLCLELNIPLESESRYSAGNTRTYSTQSGPVGRFFSAYEKYLKYALEATDKFFESGSSAAVSQSIRDLGAKSGLTEEQIAGIAQRAGTRRTFKEDRALARAAKKIKEGANYIGVGDVGAGDILMPFAGVPMDLAHTAIDYSGNGVTLGIKEMMDVVKAAKNGEKTIKNTRTGTEMPLEVAQRKAVSDFGRGVTGVGLIALSTAAAAFGAIKVHDSEDWERKGLEQAQNLNGVQMNLSAIWRGLTGKNENGEAMKWRSGEDVVIGMDFLEPFNSAMTIGYMVSQEPDFISMVKNYPRHAFTGVLQAIMGMPVMTLFSEIQDFVKSIGETDEEGNSATVDALGQVAGTVATSAVPSFVRQAAQTIDPYYRDTYDPNPWRQAGNQILASIPFASKTLPEKYDAFGNVQKRYDDSTTGGKIRGALSNMVLPDDIEKIGGNEITDYIRDLADSTGETSMIPEEKAPYKFTVRGQEIELTGENRATYQKNYGEKNFELYGGLINYPGFKDLPEDVQISAFERAKMISARFAKASVADYRDIPAESTEDLIKDIFMDSVNSTFSAAFDDLTDSEKFGYDTAAAKRGLDDAFNIYSLLPEDQKRQFLGASTGRVKYFLHAKEAGMSTEQFTTMYGEYRDINDSESMNSTEKAHEWATILEESVDSGYITESQKRALKEDLVFRFSLVAETEKFDTMINSGLPTNIAELVSKAVRNATGTGSYDIETKKYTVREIDKRQAIAESRIPDAQKDIAMLAYMPDYDPSDDSPDRTEVKYLYARNVLGLDPEEFVETSRAYSDNSKKADKISAIEELGYTRSYAEKLYYLFNGNQKKVPSVEWYEKAILMLKE